MFRINSFRENVKWKVFGSIALYGAFIGIVVSILRWIDYNHLMHTWPTEIYAGVVALVFAAVGIWIGVGLRNKSVPSNETTIEVRTSQAEDLNIAESASEKGISKREIEVLQLMAEGYSNQEIADRLFVSLNTVKTHTSNLYAKLEVRRRTQAVHRAKELGLIHDHEAT
jgi:two-component system, NarL family, response regulator LiaR